MVGFLGFNAVKPLVGCAASYSLVEKALVEYVKENDGKVPNANTWQDDLRPYYAKVDKDGNEVLGVFKPDGEWSCTASGQKTGIAFNTNVSKEEYEKLDQDTVIIFETDRVSNNQNWPYTPLRKSESPKIFGTPRGWLTITPKGVSDLD